MEDALKALFKAHFRKAAAKVSPIQAHGSPRKIFRVEAKGASAVGVVNADRRENRAFIEFSRHFRRKGLPVPEVYAEDEAAGAYLEEDLGDTTLFEFLSARRTREGFPGEVVEAYRKVVRELPRFQVVAGESLDKRFCYPRASFDRQSMLWDLNHFKYYFLRLAKIPFDEGALEEDFSRFAEFLLAADRDYFLYRDFQSRNVMLRDGKPWFIDYQGGREGALQYDVASLLYDAKADIPFALRDELLDLYLHEASKHARISRPEFLRYYPGFVFIRIMQAMGAYGLRGFYEGKSHFLQSIPYAIRNIEHLLLTTRLPVALPALMKVFRSLTASSALRQIGSASLKLTVRIQSFSYKNGAPTDDKGHGGGFVFDCRALPNPGREARFAALTGRDRAVAAYLEKKAPVRAFLNSVFALVDASVENYQKRNFTDLLVSFGCTGGRHRSVYCAERLARHLRGTRGLGVEVRHREQEGPSGVSTP